MEEGERMGEVEKEELKGRQVRGRGEECKERKRLRMSERKPEATFPSNFYLLLKV